MIGTKLAHYEITNHLGSGGMGDVYQATDSKLGRKVAIKVLPEAFTNDSDRLARFEREARILASLNHSNIAAIFGLDESGNRKFLVMELVGGETLAERIKRGPIPVDESLGIAKQICEALESAHEKGIIHRDLKPANVKITPDGKVKVLDFGLAKAFESEATNSLSHSPTLSLAATNAGMILGTAAYMSPEQAKGRAVDRRTDIFAFGCVLYEMLTGQAVFSGDEVGEILARVIEREPAWGKLPVKTPPRIDELLRRCLEKDPTKRRRDAGDLRLDIEQALTEPAGATSTSAPVRSSRLAWVALAFAAIIIVALAIPAVRYLRETSPSEMRVEIVTPPTSDTVSFAISPDGRQIVYVASGDGVSRLWVRPLDKTTAQPLPGTENASYPFWSPDSRSVGFFADGKLKRFDIGGGSPQALTAAAARGGTWNVDGVILFAQSANGPLFRIPASGGQAVAVTKVDRQTSHRWPQFLPDGRQFLFYGIGAEETTGIYLGSLDSPETKRLMAAATSSVYVPSGWLLWVRTGMLVAQRLDLERKELAGDPVTVADPVGFDGSNGTAAFSVSAAGPLAYRAGGASRRQLSWFDRAGKALGTIGEPDESGLSNPSISPDGRRVAVIRTVQGNRDIWLLDAVRASRFTYDTSFDVFPVWSSDGSQIVFDSNRTGTRNLYIKPSSGVGSEKLLLESTQAESAIDWSADGRFLLYSNIDPQTRGDLWVRPMEGDRKSWPFLKTSFNESGGAFSPDGRWVAYMSNESGQNEIYIRPFVEPSAADSGANHASGQWQVSTAGGVYPRWRPDGKELYYIGPEGQMMAALITAKGTKLELGAPTTLFQTRVYGGAQLGVGRNYDVAPDGRFLINAVLDDASSPITLLMNWKSPAK